MHAPAPHNPQVPWTMLRFDLPASAMSFCHASGVITPMSCGGCIVGNCPLTRDWITNDMAEGRGRTVVEFDIAFAFVPLTGWSETISPRLALPVRVQSLSRLAVAMCQLGDYIAHPSLCSSLEPSTCCNKMCSTGCSSGTTPALTLPAWLRNLYLLNRYLVATEGLCTYIPYG